MNREYKGRWYTAMLYGLMLLLIFGGCAKKAVISDKGIETPEERKAFPAETGDQAVEAEYVFPQDQILPEPAKIEERELQEEEKESREAGPLAKPKEFFIGLGDIFFDFDRNIIRPDARVVLEKNAQWLKENPKVRISIEGHADARGTNEYNLALGERRAMVAKKYLEALGIYPERIKTISYGEEKPFCTGSNESCWQQNRRAHFLAAD